MKCFTGITHVITLVILCETHGTMLTMALWAVNLNRDMAYIIWHEAFNLDPNTHAYLYPGFW